MAFWDSLFQPRRRALWWVQFTENYPVVPNLIAIVGLVSITLALAQFTGIRTANLESGANIQSQKVETVSQSAEVSTNPVSRVRQLYRTWFPEEVRSIVYQLYHNPALYLFIPFLLLLEFLFPVNASQPLIGKAFLQDTIWFVAYSPIKILILFPIGTVIQGIFAAHRQFFDIGAAAAWPMWIRAIAALLLSEFIFWFNHFVRHKVRVLWLFHAVHHSQKQINVFTEDRDHIVDAFVQYVVAFFPFFLFQLPNFFAVTAIGLYMPIHNRFIHSNIKLNLGWLGWVITSPQFHRVHHSALPEHADKNFGGHFSLFDHLFGTACRSTNVYPETGIVDSQFPFEDNLKWWQLPANWLKQTVYPFAQLFEEQTNRVRVLIGQQQPQPAPYQAEKQRTADLRQ